MGKSVSGNGALPRLNNRPRSGLSWKLNGHLGAFRVSTAEALVSCGLRNLRKRGAVACSHILADKYANDPLKDLAYSFLAHDPTR